MSFMSDNVAETKVADTSSSVDVDDEIGKYKILASPHSTTPSKGSAETELAIAVLDAKLHVSISEVERLRSELGSSKEEATVLRQQAIDFEAKIVAQDDLLREMYTKLQSSLIITDKSDNHKYATYIFLLVFSQMYLSLNIVFVVRQNNCVRR
jgi:hypothetical protein